MDLSFDIRIVDPADTLRITTTLNQGTNQARDHPNWSLDNASLQLPSSAPPGIYTVDVHIRNNLTGQTGSAISRIRVLPWKPLGGKAPTKVTGTWQGTMNRYTRQ
jgi:hypothetical protein